MDWAKLAVGDQYDQEQILDDGDGTVTMETCEVVEVREQDGIRMVFSRPV